jgi:hypothetical protein
MVIFTFFFAKKGTKKLVLVFVVIYKTNQAFTLPQFLSFTSSNTGFCYEVVLWLEYLFLIGDMVSLFLNGLVYEMWKTFMSDYTDFSLKIYQLSLHCAAYE